MTRHLQEGIQEGEKSIPIPFGRLEILKSPTKNTDFTPIALIRNIPEIFFSVLYSQLLLLSAATCLCYTAHPHTYLINH